MNNSYRPRNPPLALAMSLVLPGFGQLYNGQPNKAIWLFLGIALLSIPGVALMALYLPAAWTVPALVTGGILAIAIWMFGMIDAWQCARRAKNYLAAEWQVSGVYALTLLVCSGLALPLLIGYVRNHEVASFRIPSASMEPSVLRGDILFADKRYNCPDCRTAVQRGDVAIFTYPNDRTLNYIKRVIALPGDRVRTEGRAVWVNDKPLTIRETASPTGTVVTEGTGTHQWQVQWSATEALGVNSTLTVPPGQAFVLGDNRSASQDSRSFGTVPLDDIIGKARQIWFSAAPADGIRWSRLGTVVD